MICQSWKRTQTVWWFYIYIYIVKYIFVAFVHLTPRRHGNRIHYFILTIYTRIYKYCKDASASSSIASPNCPINLVLLSARVPRAHTHTHSDAVMLLIYVASSCIYIAFSSYRVWVFRAFCIYDGRRSVALLHPNSHIITFRVVRLGVCISSQQRRRAHKRKVCGGRFWFYVVRSAFFFLLRFDSLVWCLSVW